MKKVLLILSLAFIICSITVTAAAQCAMCTKTAQQLGEKPAAGLNSAIIYLMMTPLLIIGVIGYRWWKSNRNA